MRRGRAFSAVAIGVAFMAIAFNRPQQKWTWIGVGAAMILLGVFRWVRAGPPNS